MKTEAENTVNFPKWIDNDILELSYAVVDFQNHSITWKPDGYTPRRHSAIKQSMEHAYGISSIALESVDNV